MKNSIKTKQYAILVCYEVGGEVAVKAGSRKQAEKLALKKIADIGEEAIVDTKHRDYYIA